jgi:hypothetical protein
MRKFNESDAAMAAANGLTPEFRNSGSTNLLLPMMKGTGI